jgi:hypothetical protein
MPQDYRFLGEIGQKLGEALLLRFLVPARPEPDPGLDAFGHLRREYASDPRHEGVLFGFQFKTGAIRTLSKNVVNWINRNDQIPVFLIHVNVGDVERQCYRFLALHEWMLRNPRRSHGVITQAEVSFSILDFHQVDSDGGNFLRVLRDEADRILKKPSSLWRTLILPSLPISEPDLFAQFGRLRTLEASTATVDHVRSIATTNQDAFGHLRQAWMSALELGGGSYPPEVRGWVDPIIQTPSREKYTREINEFRKFVDAMTHASRGEHFHVPGFTWDEVSCWRIFVQLFPGSFGLLQQLAKYPDRWSPNQLMAGANLLSTLTSSGDSFLSGAAHAALKELSSRLITGHVYSFSSYLLVRQLHYAEVEAKGDRLSVGRCKDFINAHPARWDFALNRKYYRDSSDLSLARSTVWKLENPKERDLRTVPICEFFLDRLPKDLVDSVRRTSETTSSDQATAAPKSAAKREEAIETSTLR